MPVAMLYVLFNSNMKKKQKKTLSRGT